MDRSQQRRPALCVPLSPFYSFYILGSEAGTRARVGPPCKLPLLLLSRQQDWAPLINPTALGGQGATHLPDTILLLSGASPQKDGPFPQRVEPLLGSPLHLPYAPLSILGLCSPHGGSLRPCPGTGAKK